MPNGFIEGQTKEILLNILQGFEHTTAVMQTKEGLERVAYEMMEDMTSRWSCLC
ncbi:MAG: hypothetical protein MZV64_33185 [Ignavibacteriales bacterium]|nr:hypothetical protein [Ignavibacteriales bacterium]